MSNSLSFGIPERSYWEIHKAPQNGKIKKHAHYFPLIGRGSIIHATVSHEKVEEDLKRAFSSSFTFKKLTDWFCDLIGWW